MREIVKSRFVRLSVEKEVLQRAADHCTEQDAQQLNAMLELQELSVRHCDIDRFNALDYDFHKLICQIARSEFAYDVILAEKSKVDRLCTLSLSKGDRMPELVEDHRAIATALQANDPATAIAAGVHHLSRLDETITKIRREIRAGNVYIYRGKHCPRCKRFLNKLNDMLSDWTDALDVLVVSADTREKAQADRDEFGWNFDLGFGLSEDQMRALGLYVSDPLSEAETTDRFAEPGAFGIRPDGTLMLVDISNGPAARPDLVELLDGMKFNIANNRPVRGLA